MRHTPLSTLLALALTCSLSARADENWPQFRGPTGQGVTDSKGLPTTWSETEHVKWKAPIHGRAWSSPVIWGKQVWLTSATDEGRELFAICVDKETGKIVHDVKVFDDPVANQVFRNYNTYASPTPVVEEGRLYVTFGAAGTACLDTATAKPLWARTDIKVNHWRGAGSSLLMFQDLLIVDFDGADAQFVIALNKKTGETAWQTTRSLDYQDLGPSGKPKDNGDFRKAFSTCRVATVNGKPAVISTGSSATYAYEPLTGKEVWRLEHRGSHSAGATPVVGDGLIYIAPGFGKSAVMAVRPDGTGVLPEANVAFKVTKNAPGKPSPLLVGDLLYFVDDGAWASCVEAKTGKEVWRQRIAGKNFSAAPLYGDGKIYFSGEDGTTTVAAEGRTFKALAENKLDSGFRATIAVSGKALFLRTQTHLYRVEE